jgi:ketosteroid isomerase-like protein
MQPTSALVFGKISLFGDAKDGGGNFKRQIWETLAFEKADGNWTVVHEHSTRAKAEL